MADDRAAQYRPPYEGLDHNTLWKSLHQPAGDPDQIDGLSTVWKEPVKATLDDFVLDLDRDLTDLRETWKGDGGEEFKRRLDMVVKFGDELSKHVSVIKGNLDTWSAFLREAQKNAPDPADTDDMDATIGGAAVGAAVGGPVGALVGGLIGHAQDEGQKADALSRIIDIIANLAMEYDTNDAITDPPPFPPVELPDSSHAGSNEFRALYKADVPVADGFAPAPEETTPGTTTPGGPAHAIDDPAAVNGSGGALLGAGPGTFTGISAGTTGTLGLAGAGSGILSPGSPPAPSSGLMAGALAGSGASPRGLGQGTLPGQKPVPGEPAGTNGKNGTRPGLPTRRDEDEEPEEEYDTWLTEDDIVWGDEENAPPQLPSARRPEEDEAPSTADTAPKPAPVVVEAPDNPGRIAPAPPPVPVVPQRDREDAPDQGPVRILDAADTEGGAAPLA